MRDITARSRVLFWSLVTAVLLLSALPSMVLIEKIQAYYHFLVGWNPGTLRQLTVSYVPHRGGEAPKSPAEIRYVDFRISAPRAKSVELSGSFNQWQSLPLKKDALGGWKILIPLPKGTYAYFFLVDGKRTLDPKSLEKAQCAGEECSVRQVR